MADEKEDDKVVAVTQADDDGAKDFAAGFESGDAPAVDAPLDAKDIVAAEGETAEPPATVADEATPVDPPAPQTVVLSQADYDRLMDSAAKTDSLEQQVHKVAGLTGNLKQAYDKFSAETPAGQPIEVTDEDVAELREDYPELANATKAYLQRVFNKVRSGVRVVSNAPDPEAINRMVTERVRLVQEEILEAEIPGWRKEVGTGPDDDTEYRRWLKTKPVEYQDRMATTESSSVLGASVKEWRAERDARTTAQLKELAPKAARKSVVADAIAPKGDGGRPAPPKSEMDLLKEGFATGRA